MEFLVYFAFGIFAAKCIDYLLLKIFEGVDMNADSDKYSELTKVLTY